MPPVMSGNVNDGSPCEFSRPITNGVSDASAFNGLSLAHARICAICPAFWPYLASRLESAVLHEAAAPPPPPPDVAAPVVAADDVAAAEVAAAVVAAPLVAALVVADPELLLLSLPH